MQIIELYFQCFTLTSFLFAIIILFLFSISKYLKRLERYDRKCIQAIHQSLEATADQQRLSEIGNDDISVEVTRCLNTTKASTIGLYDYNMSNEILLSEQTQYFDISCCNQESLPCHRHGTLPVQKCVTNDLDKY
uniref:DUF3301 domain-containing protein n=1 Tax=Strongyloides venezuelensis TaxID=75913 RepID=A0A0K0FKX7_STRVS